VRSLVPVLTGPAEEVPIVNVALRPARLLTVLAALAALLVMPAIEHTHSAGAAVNDACGTRIARPGGGLWACSFVDNFNGARLDTTRWAPQNSALSGFYMHDTCFKAGQGYVVGNGQLKLTVRRVAPFTCNVPGDGDFTSTSVGGAVSTYGRFSQTYGRFEARIRFPNVTTKGLHGGFWMNPQERAYGAWPASGEIDVAEWFSGAATRLYPSLHYTGRTSADTAYTCTTGSLAAFHKVAVVWSRTRMQFFYDGRLCFDRTWTPTTMEAPKPFDRDFTASLIAALGTGSNAPTSSTPKAATTTVDYVKVWR
jgi:beta-glucanase (GH16 family)